MIQHQKEDAKLNQIRERLDRQEEKATQYYCVHEDILFVKTKPNQNTWKLLIPKETATAVSYTHLDVYKRQRLHQHFCLFYLKRSQSPKVIMHASVFLTFTHVAHSSSAFASQILTALKILEI